MASRSSRLPQSTRQSPRRPTAFSRSDQVRLSLSFSVSLSLCLSLSVTYAFRAAGDGQRPFFRLFGDQRSLGEKLEPSGPTRPGAPAHPNADESTSPAADRAMIDAFHAAMQAQGKAAPRFHLERGEALIVDNWRLLHGRDRYFDKRRSLWRVWFWTEESAGVALPSNDWRLTHLDDDEASLAARRAAGYDPKAIAAAIKTPPAHDAML